VNYVRIDGGNLVDPTDWNADGVINGPVNQDINFDGVVNGAVLLNGADDWANLRTDQVGGRRNMFGFSVGTSFTGSIDVLGGVDFLRTAELPEQHRLPRWR
jgi:hypothetical protein